MPRSTTKKLATPVLVSRPQTPAEQLEEKVDAITLRLEQHRSLTRMFGGVFMIAEQAATDGSTNRIDSLWEGLNVVSMRMEDELEELRNRVMDLQKGGAR